ncbi:RBP11-like subunits of RNA polymerase [Ceratobasidium sp. AG-I]|nr:RBP11-like subunits of RNA polymerase [Ceratobasidium sp. AG-I]
MAEVTGIAEGTAKITLLKGWTKSAATYCIINETHTIGNTLRWMLMKNPKVEFCGYSVPHPSENKIHIRIQMYDEEDSLEALITALDNLDQVTAEIGTRLNDSMEAYMHD